MDKNSMKRVIMEFNVKLQELRKNKGLTQEELAAALFVSRTAISKWESGRGYPSIDSLKMIAKFFSVTVDELLSGEEVLSIAEEDGKQKENRICTLIFGLVDISVLLLLFLPIFGQESDGVIESVALLSLLQVPSVLRVLYIAVVTLNVLNGIIMLALQSLNFRLWERCKYLLSLILSIAGVFVFIVSSHQVYAAVLLFVLLIIKVFVLIKKH